MAEQGVERIVGGQILLKATKEDVEAPDHSHLEGRLNDVSMGQHQTLLLL